jgi:hypothetical protein
MNRKLKNLGMAILAALAMTAVSAPAASAAEFHAGFVYSLSGSQVGEDVSTFSAGTVRCNEITYSGELRTPTSSTLTLAPSFSKCTAFGFVGASVDVNGCEYVFHTGAEGSTEIVCPAEKSIVVTAFNCWVTVGPQTLKTVSYTNEEAEGLHDIRINTNLTGMNFTQHSKSFPGCPNGSFSNGKTTGALTLKASAVEAGIWHE